MNDRLAVRKHSKRSGTGAPEPDSLAVRYVELGLRLGKHQEGFVDAYYGPTEISERITAERRRPARLLKADAEQLIDDVAMAESLAPQRRRWPIAQLTGWHTVARRLSGEELLYSDEVELCYGVRPRRVSERELNRAHKLVKQESQPAAPAVLSGAFHVASRAQLCLTCTETVTLDGTTQLSYAWWLC